jgi:hypothetical protein
MNSTENYVQSQNDALRVLIHYADSEREFLIVHLRYATNPPYVIEINS